MTKKSDLPMIQPLTNDERLELVKWEIKGDFLIIPNRAKKTSVAGQLIKKLTSDYGGSIDSGLMGFENVTGKDLSLAISGLFTWNHGFVFPYEHNRCTSSVGIQTMIMKEMNKRGRYADTLEPSAGSGELAHFLKERSESLDCIEIDERRCSDLIKFDLGMVTHGDFMAVPVRKFYDLIVMHPPLWSAMEHFMKAMLHLKKGGKLIGVLPSDVVTNRSEIAQSLRIIPKIKFTIIGIDHCYVGRKNTPVMLVTVG